MGNIELIDQITAITAYSKKKSYRKEEINKIDLDGIVDMKKV